MLNINCRAGSQPAQKPLDTGPHSLPVFHSKDLEDTDCGLGLPWCGCLHGQCLHEGAGTPARGAGIRAVSSPAHPHQGEPQAACTHRIKDWLLAALSPCRSFLGAMGTTLCSTTLTPTLFLMATRAPITEGMDPFPSGVPLEECK